MWVKAILIAGVVAAAGAPQWLRKDSASPDLAMLKAGSQVETQKDGRFAPTCSQDEVVDLRPDPAWMRASFNNDTCQAPSLPAVKNGAAATREEIVAAMANGKAYAAAAAAFEKCVGDFVDARRTNAARGGPPMAETQVIIENHRILASQRRREAVAAQVRVAITAFNRYGSECPE